MISNPKYAGSLGFRYVSRARGLRRKAEVRSLVVAFFSGLGLTHRLLGSSFLWFIFRIV